MDRRSGMPERGEEQDDLSKQLKNLRKVRAPWYFETELQRRLDRAGFRTMFSRWLTGPVPAYGLSAIGVLALATVSYFVLLNRPPESVHPVDEGQPAQVPVELSPAGQKPPAPLPHEALGGTHGPSAPADLAPEQMPTVEIPLRTGKSVPPAVRRTSDTLSLHNDSLHHTGTAGNPAERQAERADTSKRIR